jgi:competence protein ComEA
MKDRIKDYFAFNKKEQRGLIVLLVLMLLVVSAEIFMPYLLPDKQFDITPFQKEVEQFLASAKSQDSAKENSQKSYYNDYQKDDQHILESFRSSPFYFDPNKLSEQQWQQMGMDGNIIRNIMRYTEKGGQFYNSEGFRKIYGMNDSIFATLEPYLRFENEEPKPQYSKYDTSKLKYNSYKENNYKKYEADTVIIELNSADSGMLLSLTGIGPSYAGRIIKYRDRLGGFYKNEQLLEIKGMDSMRYNQFMKEISTDPLKIKRIDLNTVTFKELMKHPYFEYYLVKAIFNKKDEVKKFDSVQQLKSISVMYEELYEKIEPYLEVRHDSL